MATRTKKKTIARGAVSGIPRKPPATATPVQPANATSPPTRTTNEFAGLRISALEFIEALKQLPDAE